MVWNNAQNTVCVCVCVCGTIGHCSRLESLTWAGGYKDCIFDYFMYILSCNIFIVQVFFLSQELKWRTGAATFWTLTLMPVALVLFVLLVNFKVFRPFLWIQGTFLSTIISFPL